MDTISISCEEVASTSECIVSGVEWLFLPDAILLTFLIAISVALLFKNNSRP